LHTEIIGVVCHSRRGAVASRNVPQRCSSIAVRRAQPPRATSPSDIP
jgi:hypothetical protein